MSYVQFQPGQILTKEQVDALVKANPLDNGDPYATQGILSPYHGNNKMTDAERQQSAQERQYQIFQRTGPTDTGQGAGDPTAKADAGYYTTLMAQPDGTYKVTEPARWVGSRQQDIINSDHFNPGTLIAGAILAGAGAGLASNLGMFGATGATGAGSFPADSFAFSDAASAGTAAGANADIAGSSMLSGGTAALPTNQVGAMDGAAVPAGSFQTTAPSFGGADTPTGMFGNDYGASAANNLATQGVTGSAAGGLSQITPAQLANAASSIGLDTTGLATVQGAGTGEVATWWQNLGSTAKDALTKKLSTEGVSQSVLDNLVNAGLSAVGQSLSNGAVADANAANLQQAKDYAASLDKTQQDRLAAQTGLTSAAIDAMTPAQKALFTAQNAAKTQGMLSDVNVASIGDTHLAQAGTKQANSLLAAGTTAANMAKFTPYGITNNFGSSDSSGNVKLDPRFQAQFDQLYGTSNDQLKQYQGSMAATAPMGDAAARMMTLGNGYLASTPQEQAQKWMNDQLALLNPQRAADKASLDTHLLNTGRTGLSIGGDAGMMAANPELAAYYNANHMQDLGLAANATQQGQNYATYGANLVNQGGSTLQNMYGTQKAALDPYLASFGGMQGLQAEAQKNATFGADLGTRAANAGANAGQLMLSGARDAANAQFGADSRLGQYGDFTAAQRAGINGQSALQQTVGETQADYNARLMHLQLNSDLLNPLSKTAANIPNVLPAASTAKTNDPSSVWGGLMTGIANQRINWGG